MQSRLDCIVDWRRIARVAGYRVEEMARIAAVTPRELERYFLSHFQTSPKAWLDQLRMRDAQRLIRRGMMIKEVSVQLGFKHPQHFTRAFKRVSGAQPTTFRHVTRPDIG